MSLRDELTGCLVGVHHNWQPDVELSTVERNKDMLVAALEQGKLQQCAWCRDFKITDWPHADLEGRTEPDLPKLPHEGER